MCERGPGVLRVTPLSRSDLGVCLCADGTSSNLAAAAPSADATSADATSADATQATGQVSTFTAMALQGEILLESLFIRNIF